MSETCVSSRGSLLLAIESSCDETAVAVIAGGGRVLANRIASQTELHAPYGGVVPELASRAHIERIIELLDCARSDAGLASWAEVDAIAATKGPGLAGCLLVGLETAKSMALALGKPFVGVHHIAGHLWSVFARDAEGRALADVSRRGEAVPIEEFTFPYIGLVVSGGHSSIALVEGPDRMRTLGHTMDDAAGEAYDKVAKWLGLGYPGGPLMDRLAMEMPSRAGGRASDSYAAEWGLPRPLEGRGGLLFSFSGLKTAAARAVERAGGPDAVRTDAQRLGSFAAAFQERIVESLVEGAQRAIEETGVKRLAVVGGVACNKGLRRGLRERFGRRDVVVAVPPPILCTDNAAMIGLLGAELIASGRRDTLDLNATPSLALEAAAGTSQ